MRPFVGVAVVLFGATTLAACAQRDETASQGTDAEPQATLDESLTSSPSSEPPSSSHNGSLPGITPSDPAEAYLDMVRPSNCALHRYQAAEASLLRDGRFWRDDWPDIETELLPFANARAAAAWTLLESFEGFDWPVGVDKFGELFKKEVRLDAKWFDALAATTTWADFEYWISNPTPDWKVGADIRKVLGLPPPGEDGDPCVDDDSGSARRTS